jgi:transcriptional regulator with XRE-family HTH domain
MVTEFGKFIRKLRIDNTVTLRSMADDIGISPSYLSSVETGKRSITSSFFDSVAKYFNLGHEKIVDLRHLADISQLEISMSFKEATPEQKNSAVAFARQLNDLTADELKKIDDILERL